ncbi:putative colanic acid biosynthesis acetyltransferase WcaF [Celeribacter marinus]|uniref:Colanic acid biosynthesis acetyltransferase WcaF n=2 Tax=Celeribacter marinus TaxID=1397108 RepID=A0A0N9ZBC3_9RHOB|nr:colanic acid biosynthesis acetyltransferase WcaF [Celeribacter marinus]SFL03067.1 putative colanic acid biosynthesis acetyltransferase WcaF [Celeribacter marinus]
MSRLLWGTVYGLLFRPTPRWALHGWRRGLLRAFGAQVGTGCRIDPSARIWMPANLRLGDYVAIGEGADIYCVAPITIGSKVAISQRAFLCTASHDITDLARPLTHAPIRIENHAWIAAEAMLFPGAQIGEGAVIAGRAVFRGDAAPWTIHAGNPACQVGTRKLATTDANKPPEETP